MESWWELGEWSGHSGNTMQVWRLTCPFCKEEGNFALAHHAEKQKGSSGKKLNFDLYQCLNCMAYVHVFWSAAERSIGHPLSDFMMMPWPIGKAKPSENWPPDVQRFGGQAHELLGIENWDAAAVMARSAVQVTMRDKRAVEKDLYSEIEDLAKKGDLPPLMKDWSHEIRVLGNESTHPKPSAPQRGRTMLAMSFNSSIRYSCTSTTSQRGSATFGSAGNQEKWRRPSSR